MNTYHNDSQMVAMPSGYRYDMHAKEIAVLMVEPGKHPKLSFLSIRLPTAFEVVRLAKPVLGDQVSGWSTKGGREKLVTDDVLSNAVDITRLQVPPSTPKEIQVFVLNTWIFFAFGDSSYIISSVLGAGFSFTLTFNLIRSKCSQ